MNIKELIEKDLYKYDQDNSYPESLTIKEGDLFRHYELGPIIGFCIWNQINMDGSQWFGIQELHEDDDFWFIPEQGMFMSCAWISEVNKTWKRLISWFDEHIHIEKNYNTKLIKSV